MSTESVRTGGTRRPGRVPEVGGWVRFRLLVYGKDTEVAQGRTILKSVKRHLREIPDTGTGDDSVFLLSKYRPDLSLLGTYVKGTKVSH